MVQGINMTDVETLKQQLANAIKRAEDAARFAEDAVERIKNSEKRIKKAKLKIKALEKMILAEKQQSEEKSKKLLNEVTSIAAKASKKHKAIKKLSKKVK